MDSVSAGCSVCGTFALLRAACSPWSDCCDGDGECAPSWGSPNVCDDGALSRACYHLSS